MAPAPPRIDRYEVERLIGSGSFATVWLARDPGLGGQVAIKVLADNWAHDLRVHERFVEEARLLWRLDDERLVRVHVVGETDDGRPYLVMSYADRGSLRDRLDALRSAPPEGRVDLLARIADGVAVLHAHGIVHRDLTPANVLFRSRHDGTEQVLVADLGLAKALAASSGFTARAGTPGYMAPEQDADLALVDARTDVYALGVLGRELLGADAPPGAAAVLAAATAADPDDRPADAAAFAARLRATAASEVATAAPSPEPPRRRRGRVVAVATVLTALAAAAVVIALRRSDDRGDGGVAWDRSHRVGVALPPGWRTGGRGGWRDLVGPGERAEPALVVGTRPFRWAEDPSVPGAFVGLSPAALAAGTTAEAFLASRAHAGCPAGVPGREAHGGRTWTVVTAGPCADGRTVVDAVTIDPAGLLYVQASAPDLATVPVAALLDGVQVS